MGDAAIALSGIRKRYGERLAVDGIDLVVPAGTFFGLLGPNGAGKTTTLSIATGLLRPDAGTARIHGVDVWREPLLAKRMIGVLADYSAGMTKKIALACALIHSPRLLVLDEPFESVDPVSAANIRDILAGFVALGGTVVVSSHSMDLVERMCDHVAIIASGRVLAAGALDAVRAGRTLEDRFLELVGGRRASQGPEWLRPS